MFTLQTRLPTYGFSVDLGLLRFVVLGRYARMVSTRETAAIVAHEQGHLYHHHVGKRILALLSGVWLQDDALAALCRRQEHEADAYAVRLGYAPGLLAFLARHTASHEDPLHPSPKERIAAIMNLMSSENEHGK